jgi:tRNA-binding protein
MESFVPAPIKPEITIQDIERIDVRIGAIIAVEDIQESDKLVCLTVDFGDKRRTILVGMKGERSNPAHIVGRQALFVVNLKPRTMFGRTSEGMLFDIGYQDGLVPVLAVAESPVPNGARAG